MPHCKDSTVQQALPDLSGRVCLVTGGNSGIGLTTVENLALRGARVYMGSRSPSKASAVIDQLRVKHTSATLDIRPLTMDLASLTSVREAAQVLLAREDRLHLLINNAGIMAVDAMLTEDDFDVQMQTNYVGHWLLTKMLTPRLLQTSLNSPLGSVRVINVSSDAHDMMAPKGGLNWSDMAGTKLSNNQRYGASKTANILHAKMLHNQYGPGSKSATLGKGEIWTASLHPGIVHTGLQANADDFLLNTVIPTLAPVLKAVGALKTADQGCLASLFCAASDKFTPQMSGQYFRAPGKIGKPSKYASDDALCERLESWTVASLNERGFGN